jgi:hypothetical protein
MRPILGEVLNMRKKYLFILIIVLILSFTACNKSSTNVKKYLNSGGKIDTYAKSFMPAINDLPKYQDMSYKYNRFSSILSDTDTMTLAVHYDEETYKKEKEKLEEKYRYLEQKVVSDFDKSKYYIPDYEFSINSYNFRVANGNDNYSAKYPKSFAMLGTSDEKKSIAYLYFYDYDLDYIENDSENPMGKFVKKYFKYDF